MKTSTIYSILISLACATFIGLRSGSAQTSAQNFIWTRKAQVPIVGDLNLVSDKNHVNESIQYFDDLGRPLQTVDKQSTPLGNDFVTFFVYDEYGRRVRSYLPYPSTESNGSMKTGPVSNQQTFYEAHAGTADGSKAYADQVLETSALGRLMKQGAPGADWQVNADPFDHSDRTVKKEYTSNLPDEVLLWRYDAETHLVMATSQGSPVYYDAGQLVVEKTFDEQNTLVIECKDKLGHVILKRVQATENQTSVDSVNYASTYYIYDKAGNLVCVIQPEGVKHINEYFSANEGDKDKFLDRWAFRYRYDGRQRMIEKQVPGAEPVYMVYDARDRLVLTQDGNQRAASPYLWTFTKYDELNRPILTGIKDTTGGVSQADMQDAVNAYYANPNAQWGETFDPSGPIHQYSNRTFPVTTSDGVVDANHYLTVTYYDNYDFRSQWVGTYAYTDDNLVETVNGQLYQQPDEEPLRVTNQITGSKIKVLDGGTRGGYSWLKAVNYYDDKYRLIQAITDNYKGGIDRSSNLYDFTGKLLKSKTVHTTNEISWQGLANAVTVGNNIKKTFLGMGWNAGGVTREQLPAGTDGWIECVISEPDQRRAFGLNATDEGRNYNTIDYAFWHDATAARIYENGIMKYQLPETVQSGDVIRIARVGSEIRYYRNAVLLYTTSNASTGALMGDASIDTGSGDILIPSASFNHKADSVSRRFVYDHAGRLKEIWHQVNATPEVRIAYNEYNELGQLIDKKLHSTDPTASDAVQSVDYRYNIRGWLTGMNEDDLSNGGPGEPRDYYSFQLGYNENIGMQSTPMYNGNISAMKWSRDLQSGDTIMNAYAYSYDEMNRITGAAFKVGTGSPQTINWMQPATNEFSVSQYSYDLNGNIMGLAREGKKGKDLDILEYDYGSGTSQSNQLINVSDSGSKTDGFTEIDGEGDDYKYDNNGNLVWDKNKGGEEVLVNGGFSDGNADWVITDTGSRLSFENDSLTVISHATASATLKQNDILLSRAVYVVIVDMERESGSILFNLGFGGNKSVSSSGRTVFTYQAGSGNDFVLTIPATFSGQIKSIEVKGVVVISYNYLNLPDKIDKGLQQSLRYIYDATGRKISQEVYDAAGLIVKKSDYEGEFFYQNDTLKFMNHEEGRVVMTGAEPEYQYNLKDHLGNVRLTFTTKPDSEENLATLETANAATEHSQFLNYDEAIKINYDLFDHTYDGATGASYYSTRLTGGNTNAIYGLAKSLSVMPGDTIKMQVYAKYLDPDANNWTSALGDFMAAVAGGTAPPGTVVDGGVAGSIGSGSFPFPGLLNHSGEPETAPKAYLNYIVFDRDFNPLIGESGFIRITTASKEDGTNVPHDLLKPDQPLVIKQAGYVYIYLSNENDTPVEVFFDDFQVEHIKSPVVQMDDYYPFGATFNSYSRENSTPQIFLYQEKEWQQALSLNLYDFEWRQYDPYTNRTTAMDPQSESYYSFSPYSWAANNPVILIDPDGMDVTNSMFATTYTGDDAKSLFAQLQSQQHSRNSKQQDDNNGSLPFSAGFSSYSYQKHAKERESKLLGGFWGGVSDQSAEWWEGTKKTFTTWDGFVGGLQSMERAILNTNTAGLEFDPKGNAVKAHYYNALMHWGDLTSYEKGSTVGFYGTFEGSVLAGEALGAFAPELISGSLTTARNAVGPLNQWIRIGPSYSKYLGQATRLSIRWGASPTHGWKYVNRIGSPSLRIINQGIRMMKIPIRNWRFMDPGHIHLLK